MINTIKDYLKLPSSFEDLMIFCIPSALFFSNALSAGNSGPGGSTGLPLPAYFFTLLSILCIPLSNNLPKKAFLNWLILSSAILIGQLSAVLGNSFLLIPFLYKALSFLPLFIIVSKKRLINKLIYFSVSSFLISIFLSITLLLLGFAEHKFIYYLTTFLPRFAGLAVEPGGFALGYTALIFIIFIDRALQKKEIFNPSLSLILLIPYIASFSTAFIFYVLIYFLSALDKFNLVLKKWSLFIITFLSTAALIYFNTPRGISSIIERLNIASSIILDNDTMPLLGNGIYTLKGAPGYISLGFELGLITIFLLFTCLFFNLLNKNPKQILYILISLAPVIFSETYGAVLMWLPLAVSISYGKNKGNKNFLKNKN